MKLVVAIVQSKDADACVGALVAAGHECTRLGSSGGFLDMENVTLLVGVNDADVDPVVALLKGKARRRSETIEALVAGADTMGAVIPPPMDVEIGGATIFVVDVARMERL